MKLTNLDLEFKITFLHGRIKNFPIKFGPNEEIPVLPCSRQAELIIMHYHLKTHRGIDMVVPAMRTEFWPIKVRKLAAKQEAKCLVCKMIRAQTEGQIMGDLPSYRTEMFPAFSHLAMDLFGPWEVKDDVIQRGPKILRKVWGVVYTCMAT